MYRRTVRATGVLLVALVGCGAATAAEWSQWRGENRAAIASSGPAINSLPREAKPLWKIAVGPGFASPVVAGGALVYLDEQEGKEVAHRIDPVTGKERWQRAISDSANDEWGSGPRSTPFIDGDRVYVQSMTGEFRCINLEDGAVRWGFAFENFGAKFLGSKAGEGTAARRGNSGSGIIHGGYVYVPVGAKGASIVCFDKMTGKEVWKSLSDEAAYSSFVVGKLAGKEQLVAFTADALAGLDLETGKQLWRVPFRTGAKRHASTPVLNGDTVTVNSQTIGLVCTKIGREEDRFTATELWVNKPLTINLATPVLVDNHLYSYGAIRTKDFVCVDARSGALKWSQAGFGMGKDQKDYASVIAVGRNVLVLTYDGQLVLVAANPAKYTELGRLQVCGNTWSHPAFVDGKLYLRDGRDLQCIDLAPKAVAFAK